MNMRKEKRIKKNFLVTVNHNGFDSMGLTTDLSASGLGLITADPIPIQNDICITIGVINDIYEVKGKVIWNSYFYSENAENSRWGCGIHLHHSPTQYQAYLENIND